MLVTFALKVIVLDAPADEGAETVKRACQNKVFVFAGIDAGDAILEEDFGQIAV